MPDNPLFNIPIPAPSDAGAPERGVAAPEPSAPAPGAVSSAGVITAKQSAITFAGAPAAITMVLKVIEQVDRDLGTSTLLAIGLSLAIGMLIYWQTVTPGRTNKEKISGFIFALINSFAIAAATLGIGSATAPGPGGG